MITAESIAEIIDGMPSISGWEHIMENTMRQGKLHIAKININYRGIQPAFAIALNMHQPLIIEGDIHAVA